MMTTCKSDDEIEKSVSTLYSLLYWTLLNQVTQVNKGEAVVCALDGGEEEREQESVAYRRRKEKRIKYQEQEQEEEETDSSSLRERKEAKKRKTNY